MMRLMMMLLTVMMMIDDNDYSEARGLKKLNSFSCHKQIL